MQLLTVGGHALKHYEKYSVANPGLVRPPLVFSSAVAAGIFINIFYPSTLAFDFGAKVATCAFLFGGAALFFWTHRVFRDAETAISGNRPATRLIQSGPFRYSRNPMYLAFTAFHLAAAFWLDNLWVFGTLLVALSVLSKIVIPREEFFMKAKFGAEYISYVNRTRRWL